MSHRYRVDFIFFWSTRVRQGLVCIALATCVLPAVLAVEVIINADNSAELLEEQADLRSIFSMRARYWANGEKIRVFVLPDNHDIHQAFVKQKLKMFPHQLRRTWDRMAYTGTGQSPVTVESIPEMLEKIKQTKYSIGYIERRVDDNAIHLFNAH